MAKADDKKEDDERQGNAVVTTTVETPAAASTKGQGPFTPLEISAYILAGLSTIGLTITSISNKFLDKLKEHGVYNNLWRDRERKYQELFEYALSLPELIKGKREIEKDTFTKMDLRLASAGIPPAVGMRSYFKRTWSMFKALELHDQVDIGVRLGLIATIAALAAFFLRPTKKKNTTTIKKEVVTVKENEQDADQKNNEQVAGQKVYATENLRNASSTQAGFAAAVDNARATENGEQRQVS